MRTLAIVFAYVLIAPQAIAAPDPALVLDQAFEKYGGYGLSSSAHWQIQTFTVGITGDLKKVEVALWRAGSDTQISLSIIKTQSGVPSTLPEDVLANTTAQIVDPNYEPLRGTGYDPPIFYWVPVSFPSIAVQRNEQLGIQIGSAERFSYAWAADFGSDYLGGDGFIRQPTRIIRLGDDNPSDYLFRTYVAPIPESPTMFYALSGAYSVCCLRRCRKS